MVSPCAPYVSDRIGRIETCTTAGRPTGAARYHGKAIYDVDVDLVLIWNQTTSDWDVVNGRLAVAQLATVDLPAAATEGRLFADTTVDALKIDTGAALVEFGHWGTWTSYTPTWGGVTLGNGTKSGSYFRHGSLCFFAAQLSFGSTTAVTAEVTVSTPFTMADGARYNLSVLLLDNGTAWLPGASAPSTATAIAVRAFLASGTYASTATMSSTVPFTWTTGDNIYVTGWFPIA